MRHTNGQLSFSATDLSRHLACNHLTSLRRGIAFGKLEPPPSYDDPRAEVLRQRGVEHEQGLLDQLATDGRTVEAIMPPDTPFSHRDPMANAARTRDAMRRGADVIYQGRLEDDDGRWSGYPDFLLRVDRPSALGGWSYEALDAKLARRAKGEALLQLLLYSDLLAQAQGIEPELMHLALSGGGSESSASFRVAEYAAYYRAVRRRFEAHTASPPDTYPEPVDHCGVCEWKQACASRRRDDDHPSLVAGITWGQRARLAEREVTTMAALGALRLPVSPRLDGIGDAALARIREQARVQDQARSEDRRIHELVTPVEPDKGLAALPEPSDGDVFFDLEGDVFAADGGLEYLFGVADRDGNYNPSWALDPAGERRVFQRFIDDVMAGNTNASAEEADRVATLIRELLDAGAAWVDREGVREPLTRQDVLVVAPYNAHVAVLRSTLPAGARVGTVDKFQGQEAPIVIYSMATSTADEAPRGMEFLYSLHRLNVATSRARCVAAIVANPGLLTPDCRTPEQMRLANPFCRFLELARPAPGHAGRS